ncbi:30S ribosomal protein S13 [Candidatus Woesearchaeota archaeon]|nr:30S ribosomal protein S13 [Candidatus Woesearchaeota archaeon]
MAKKEKIEKFDSNFKHIIRVANVDLPGNKQIRFALTNIKGIGINFADSLCKLAQVNRYTKAGYLAQEGIDRLNKIVEAPAASRVPSWMFNRRNDYETGENRHLFTGTLTFVHDNDIKRLKKIKTLRGIRHQMGLPVRGQRTKAHFRKHKGRVVGVSKKKVAASAAASGEKKTEKKEKK